MHKISSQILQKTHKLLCAITHCVIQTKSVNRIPILSDIYMQLSDTLVLV